MTAPVITSQSGESRPKPLLVICDHGSRRSEAHENLVEMVRLIENEALHLGVDVTLAHMEIQVPLLKDVLEVELSRGRVDFTIVPYFLAPGRHSTHDIPEIVTSVLAGQPVEFRVTEPLGIDRSLAQLVLVRAGYLGSEPA